MQYILIAVALSILNYEKSVCADTVLGRAANKGVTPTGCQSMEGLPKCADGRSLIFEDTGNAASGGIQAVTSLAEKCQSSSGIAGAPSLQNRKLLQIGSRFMHSSPP